MRFPFPLLQHHSNGVAHHSFHSSTFFFTRIPGNFMDPSMGGSSFFVQWLPLLLLLLILLLTFVSSINASIHLYDHQVFLEVGNSFLVSGGSEGIAASSDPSTATSHAHSFIRYSYSLCCSFYSQICACIIRLSVWIPRMLVVKIRKLGICWVLCFNTNND